MWSGIIKLRFRTPTDTVMQAATTSGSAASCLTSSSIVRHQYGVLTEGQLAARLESINTIALRDGSVSFFDAADVNECAASSSVSGAIPTSRESSCVKTRNAYHDGCMSGMFHANGGDTIAHFEISLTWTRAKLMKRFG